uniref:Bestrophin homolog n=1 Tax=Steinernema glaseri TaxID=37863 RepID=A0A1I8AMA4_9BILA
MIYDDKGFHKFVKELSWNLVGLYSLTERSFVPRKQYSFQPCRKCLLKAIPVCLRDPDVSVANLKWVQILTPFVTINRISLEVLGLPAGLDQESNGYKDPEIHKERFTGE